MSISGKAMAERKKKLTVIPHKDQERERHKKLFHSLDSIFCKIPSLPSLKRETKSRKLRRIVHYMTFLAHKKSEMININCCLENNNKSDVTLEKEKFSKKYKMNSSKQKHRSGEAQIVFLKKSDNSTKSASNVLKDLEVNGIETNAMKASNHINTDQYLQKATSICSAKMPYSKSQLESQASYTSFRNFQSPSIPSTSNHMIENANKENINPHHKAVFLKNSPKTTNTLEDHHSQFDLPSSGESGPFSSSYEWVSSDETDCSSYQFPLCSYVNNKPLYDFHILPEPSYFTELQDFMTVDNQTVSSPIIYQGMEEAFRDDSKFNSYSENINVQKDIMLNSYSPCSNLHVSEQCLFSECSSDFKDKLRSSEEICEGSEFMYDSWQNTSRNNFCDQYSDADDRFSPKWLSEEVSYSHNNLNMQK